jgi:predicted dehydrogenase
MKGCFMEKQICLALIGAGNRGSGIFGKYALEMPHRVKFTAVVEPDDAKRTSFAEQHRIAKDKCFKNYKEFFAKTKMAEAVIIATQEDERIDPILSSIKKGYHILTEKPLGCSPEEVIQITDAAAKFKGIFIVCHQMRYMPSYETIKSLIKSGKYGKIISIQHSENLSYHHMAHSFVRGFFNSDKMSPMILAKSCHDMDFLCYMTEKRPIRISSFGSLNYFKKENAPEGAPAFCLDGCPAYKECPYNVLKLYFIDNTDPAYIRQMGVIKSKEQLLEVMSKNRFGRCVFHCDNNVVDNQSVMVEFEGGINVSFTMAGHNYHGRRISKISMTNGEIHYDSSCGEIKAYTFEPLTEEVIKPSGMGGTHGGGDRKIMDSFVDAITAGDKKQILTPVQMSLDSHLMAYAAEKSRKTGKVINIDDFEKECRKRI